MKTKLEMVPTKSYCRAPAQKPSGICGWRPINYVQGTTHVKCIDCYATIEIEEEKPKPPRINIFEFGP